MVRKSVSKKIGKSCILIDSTITTVLNKYQPCFPNIVAITSHEQLEKVNYMKQQLGHNQK